MAGTCLLYTSVGALIGWWIAGMLGVAQTSGVDWIRWIISIIVAALGIVVYGAVTKSSTVR